MRSICIVEFPSNLGLSMLTPEKEPGVKKLPDWLRNHHFHEQISPECILRLAAADYSPLRDADSGILNADALAAYALRQANIITDLLDQDQLPLAIGGDCSILLGPAVALRQRGNYALFYLDRHTDFMDISLSASGGAAGMAASLVTGKGPQKLTALSDLAPYIQESNLWCVGNREYDDAYEDEIRRSRATYKRLDDLRREGIDTCVASFLKEVESKRLDGFWLHIDVDVLNDDLMPCVDSRTPDGLTYSEFNSLLSQLFESRLLSGLDITILDPNLDPSGKYTSAFVEQMVLVIKNRLA